MVVVGDICAAARKKIMFHELVMSGSAVGRPRRDVMKALSSPKEASNIDTFG